VVDGGGGREIRVEGHPSGAGAGWTRRYQIPDRVNWALTCAVDFLGNTWVRLFLEEDRTVDFGDGPLDGQAFVVAVDASGEHAVSMAAAEVPGRWDPTVTVATDDGVVIFGFKEETPNPSILPYIVASAYGPEGRRWARLWPGEELQGITGAAYDRASGDIDFFSSSLSGDIVRVAIAPDGEERLRTTWPPVEPSVRGEPTGVLPLSDGGGLRWGGISLVEDYDAVPHLRRFDAGGLEVSDEVLGSLAANGFAVVGAPGRDDYWITGVSTGEIDLHGSTVDGDGNFIAKRGSPLD
jgi:hypothetical protein